MQCAYCSLTQRNWKSSFSRKIWGKIIFVNLQFFQGRFKLQVCGGEWKAKIIALLYKCLAQCAYCSLTQRDWKSSFSRKGMHKNRFWERHSRHIWPNRATIFAFHSPPHTWSLNLPWKTWRFTKWFFPQIALLTHSFLFRARGIIYISLVYTVGLSMMMHENGSGSRGNTMRKYRWSKNIWQLDATYLWMYTS